MKNIICIVARTNSTRLPQKVLRELGNQKMIEQLIDRMKLAKSYDDIFLCTSTHPDDKILVEIAKNKQVCHVAGSELAVIDRLLDAAKLSDAANVVRVTGDNPLTDPYLLDYVLEQHQEKHADYSIMSFLPRGVAGDVIRVSALEKLRTMMDVNESQYLGVYINNPKEFVCNYIQAPSELFNPYLTFSVDTFGEFNDVGILINTLGIEAHTNEYAHFAEQQNICRFNPDKLIKLSESKTMRYEDYINWQINAIKDDII